MEKHLVGLKAEDLAVRREAPPVAKRADWMGFLLAAWMEGSSAALAVLWLVAVMDLH